MWPRLVIALPLALLAALSLQSPAAFETLLPVDGCRHFPQRTGGTP
jgi:hypothetical protein